MISTSSNLYLRACILCRECSKCLCLHNLIHFSFSSAFLSLTFVIEHIFFFYSRILSKLNNPIFLSKNFKIFIWRVNYCCWNKYVHSYICTFIWQEQQKWCWFSKNIGNVVCVCRVTDTHTDNARCATYACVLMVHKELCCVERP